MSAPAEDRTARLAGVEVDREPDADVLAGLDVTAKQKPLGSLRNMVHVLEQDPRWQGRLRWSRFESLVQLDGKALRDNDLTRIAIWLDEVYGVRGGADNLHRAVNVVAEAHAFHPVCDWLEGLTWDGMPRLDGLLATYFGAEDTPLHRKFSAGWLIGACARVFDPGCQLDTMVMLIGRQGVGKSRATAALVPDRAWFGDATFDIGNKDAFINLHGKWFYELAECESLKRATDDARKAFLTSRTDRYRSPFGRLAEDHLRQTVFVATTNHTEVLTDPTGAHRFWTVLVGEPDVAAIARDRDQLFAEALVRYRAGEPWHLDAEYAALLVEAQRAFEVPEAWESVLAPWVDRQDRPFTVEDALRDGLGLPVDRWDARRRQRVGKALARLGCTKVRPRAEGARRVWCWERPDRPDALGADAVPPSGVAEPPPEASVRPSPTRSVDREGEAQATERPEPPGPTRSVARRDDDGVGDAFLGAPREHGEDGEDATLPKPNPAVPGRGDGRMEAGEHPGLTSAGQMM